MRATLPILLALLLTCCGRIDAANSPQDPSHRSAAATVPDDDGLWTRPAKDYASTRFSMLDDITTTSVKQLGVKATFSTGYCGDTKLHRW